MGLKPQSNQLPIPAIPFVEPPPDLKKVAGFGKWYQQHHDAMEKWRQQMNKALGLPLQGQG